MTVGAGASAFLDSVDRRTLPGRVVVGGLFVERGRPSGDRDPPFRKLRVGFFIGVARYRCAEA